MLMTFKNTFHKITIFSMSSYERGKKKHKQQKVISKVCPKMHDSIQLNRYLPSAHNALGNKLSSQASLAEKKKFFFLDKIKNITTLNISLNTENQPTTTTETVSKNT